jgi:hypothetical protein
MQSVIDFEMQKLGFPSMKTFDQFKSLSGSAKNFSFNSRSSTDSTTSGSFANLKITAGSDWRFLLIFSSLREITWTFAMISVLDLFVCREIGQRTGFRQNRSRDGGTRISLFTCVNYMYKYMHLRTLMCTGLYTHASSLIYACFLWCTRISLR